MGYLRYATVRGNATFQVLDALSRNRKKRRERGEFLVHGVRAIDAALAQRWPMTGIVLRRGTRPSRWATRVLHAIGDVARHDLAPELFDHLAERDEPSELIGVASLPRRDLTAITGEGPVLVLDRPASPGNVGTLIRSADAFGAAGVVVVGHATDPYDPRAVRATQGAIFAVPVVEVGSPAVVGARLHDEGRWVVGLDERGDTPIDAVARDRPLALVLGTEVRGLGSGARAICDELASIPMRPSVSSSLNLAVAGSIALHAVSRA